jgi:hypothetical protein
MRIGQTGGMDTPRWLSILRRLTGVAATVVAATVVLARVLEFLIVQPVVDLIGAEGISYGFTTLWWASVAASLVILAALIAGWRLDRPAWAPGVLQVALGLVVWWGWGLLDRHIDLWGLRQLSAEQIDHFADDARLMALSYASVIVDVAIALLAAMLLVVGARRLLERPMADLPFSPRPA